MSWRVLLVLVAYGTRYSHELPPRRFQNDVTVTVRFESEERVAKDCAVGLPPPPTGQQYGGCNLPNGVMVLPNACSSNPTSELDITTCHEIGHANGWPPDHPAR